VRDFHLRDAVQEATAMSNFMLAFGGVTTFPVMQEAPVKLIH